MRRLTLLRHAEAAEPVGDQDDHDRPLTDKGRAAAIAVGKATASMPAEFVLCSPSLRTRQTLDAILPAWPTRPRILYERSLYLAPSGVLLDCIRRAPPAAQAIWLIGHNPGIAELARALAGVRSVKIEKFPTATYAVYDFSGGAWSDADQGSFTLVDYAPRSR